MLVKLRVGEATARAYITGWRAVRTFAALAAKLPVRTQARVSGGLLLIKLSLAVPPEGHRVIICPGEVAYWPPASSVLVALGDRYERLPSPINVLGFVVEGLDSLKRLPEGEYEAVLEPAHGEDVEGPLADA